MPRPLLPPRGFFTGTRLLFNPEVSASLKETLFQLMALAWGSESHTTPLLSYALLEQITGKPPRTLRGHLLALRTCHAVLRLQHADAGQFIIHLAGWLFRNDVPGEVSPLPVKEEEDSNLNLLMDGFLPLDDQVVPAPKNAAMDEPPAARLRRSRGPLSKTFTAQLLEAGVFPALIDEVAARAAQGKYNAAELAALLEWSQNDEREHPAALFITRLRAGARAPKHYQQPACPRCGQRGGHAQDCSRRYAFDG
jgi:hypothetical protein